MCGIMGWIDFNRDLTRERDVVAAMMATLVRRGPDAEGVWISQHAIVGHRRLAVIDIEQGCQPMVAEANHGHTLVITFAGEIYNHQDLRHELRGLGHVFKTRSDTEVLLRAYIEWQEFSLGRLNGMFAFGVWDVERQELFLARDRLGVKPLYYAETGDGIVFGSEMKVLLAHPSISAEVGADGLAEIFAMGLMRTPGHGIYSKIKELRPGHTLTFKRRGSRCSRYWQLTALPHKDDMVTTKHRVRELLEDAVRRQLIADVPVCSMLSGGLDSSIITANAARLLIESNGGSFDTYSVDLANDEANFYPSSIQPDRDQPWVERVAGFTGVRHDTVTVTTDELIENYLEPLYARDLPSMGDRDTSFYLLCRAIKKNHTVALSGESADELFGGYPWFHEPAALARGVFPWHASGDPGMSQFLAPDVAAYIRPAEYEKARLFEALAETPHLDDENESDRRMREVHYLNLTRFLPTLLDRKDRISMATGIEARVPFCDHLLVEYVWNIPWAMKSLQGREKGLLREAFEGLLPQDVLWRQKSAYPVTHDPVYTEAISNMLMDLINDTSAPIRPLLNIPKLRSRIIADFADERRKNGRTSLRVFVDLLQVNAWLGIYGVTFR